ncbi:MAG TPA: anti-sigma F factor [Firmicutes bacterium]|nr:anti-sigma F factor [Bacillota bacterium]
MAERNRMRLELLSLADNVGVARIAVATFAAQLDYTLPEIEEIKVAVSEAVSNVVLHAYPDGPGTMAVLARLTDEGIEIEVSDNGVGIQDVELARQASFTTKPDRMGLGFVFMESFMDSLEVSSQVGHGTIVRMFKRCKTQSAGAGTLK